MSYYPSIPSFGNGKLDGLAPPSSALSRPTGDSQMQKYNTLPTSVALSGTSSRTAVAFAHNSNIRVDQAKSLGAAFSIPQVHAVEPTSMSEARPPILSNPSVVQLQPASSSELLRDLRKTSVDREEGELTDRGVPTEPAAFRLGKRRRSSQSPISNRRVARQRDSSRRPGTINQQGTQVGKDMYRPGYRDLPATTSSDVQQPQNIDIPTEVQSTGSTQTNGVTLEPCPSSSDGITSEYLAEQRQRSKRLILELHENGYTYTQVVQDRGLNPDFLRGIYQELGIDTNKQIEEPIKSAVNAIHRLSNEHHTSSARVAAKPNIAEQPLPAPGSPAHAPLPANSSSASAAVEILSKVTHDRKDYVARLQALKSKSNSESRHEPAVVPTTNNHMTRPRNTPTENSQLNQSLIIVSPTTGGTNKAKNEELRRRLDVLKSTGVPTVSASVDHQDTSTTSDIAHESPLMPLIAERQIEQPGKEASKEQSSLPEPVFNTTLAQLTPAGRAPNLTSNNVAAGTLSERATMTGYDGCIPGLFMTSSIHQSEAELKSKPGSVVGSLSTSNTVETQHGRRDPWKRPVASDFDYEPLKSMVKCTFGQGRHDQSSEGIVIEVSDDETAQEDDRIEGILNNAQHFGQADKPAHATSKFNTTNATADTSAARVLKSVDEPKTNKVPGSTSTAAVVRENEILKDQEKRIADLKRKIADIEQKKRAKATATANGTSTPTTPKLSTPKLSPLANEVVTQISESKVHANSRTSQPVADRLAEPQAVSITSVAQTFENELNANSANDPPRESRPAGVAAVSTVSPTAHELATVSSLEERRRQIIANHSSRMELLSAHVQELQNVMRREQDDTDRQLRRLRDNTGITEDTRTTELKASEDDKLAFLDVNATNQGSLLSISATSTQTQVVEKSTSDFFKEQSINDSASSMSMSSGENDIAIAHSSSHAELPNGVHSPQTGANIPPRRGSPSSVTQGQHSLPRSPDIGVRSMACASEDMDIDMEDLYGSESGEVRSESAPEDQSGVEIVATVSEPRNSVSSDSSEEYEPPEAVDQQAQLKLNNTTPNVLPDHSSPINSEGVLSSHSDEEYEPPDAEPPRKNLITSLTNGSIVEVVSSVLGAEDSMLQIKTGISSMDHFVPAAKAQLSATASLNHLSSTAHAMADSNLFTPYESPLKMFKGYRYHPDYETNIRGGFRSITYSHNVDAHNPVCSFEAAGGHCNDSKCHDQHFREMAISDAKILVQLGTDTPGTTAEENGKYLDGLKMLVKDLRQKGINDSAVVAHAIADYRRTFMNDPTKVLKL